MNKQADICIIKKVTAETFDDFLRLVDKLAEYEKLNPPDQAARERLRKDCLSDKPRFQAYIGMLNSKPVGYIIYFFTYSSFLALPTLYLEDFFVLEKHRKNGVGQALFDFVKTTAKAEGCGRVEFTVLTWNKLAQKFYDKNKARCMSDWYFYRLVKEDF